MMSFLGRNFGKLFRAVIFGNNFVQYLVMIAAYIYIIYIYLII